MEVEAEAIDSVDNLDVIPRLGTQAENTLDLEIRWET
jgi:hypothetical protein